MVLKAKGHDPPQPGDKDVKTEIAWLIDRHDATPNSELRKFSIKPRGSIPKHYHHDVEHEQYGLAGEYEVGIGERVYRVKEGDALYVPSATIPWYVNTGR